MCVETDVKNLLRYKESRVCKRRKSFLVQEDCGVKSFDQNQTVDDASS